MDEPIDEILDTRVLHALEASQDASMQLIRYGRDTGMEIASETITLRPQHLTDLRELFLNPKTYWIGLKRCAPLNIVRITLSPTNLVAILDFRCNSVTFTVGSVRSHAFFDHRRDDLMLLVNHYFPSETSLDCATLVKKEFLTLPRK
jgi:hypothetical protein